MYEKLTYQSISAHLFKGCFTVEQDLENFLSLFENKTRNTYCYQFNMRTAKYLTIVFQKQSPRGVL